MTTWRKLLALEMACHNESMADVISCTLTDSELDVLFDDDYGLTEGIPFTVWTEKRVYFPVEYDGCEHVKSVSRNPDSIPTIHF